ncbi:hypothetical protein P879_07990 [Paragonimus westermani]|uniref:Uncharacterized protein n=1 Tax=Paragonimus westermani TaxID=34504 RepID=A0A8T0DGD4_9TREM|nr:hypothetical protein P879_07990 [Paragonimus westermani]
MSNRSRNREAAAEIRPSDPHRLSPVNNRTHVNNDPICATPTAPQAFAKRFQQCPQLIRTSKAVATVTSNSVHRVGTKGLLRFTGPRSSAYEKLKLAKAEFESLLYRKSSALPIVFGPLFSTPLLKYQDSANCPTAETFSKIVSNCAHHEIPTAAEVVLITTAVTALVLLEFSLAPFGTTGSAQKF